MLRGFTKQWTLALACLVLAGSLLVTTTVLAAHDHGPASSHSCDVCHIGHMAWTGFHVPIAFAPEVIAEWRRAAEPCQRPPDSLVSNASSRAPPA